MTVVKNRQVRRLRYRVLCWSMRIGIGIATLLPRKIGLYLFGMIGELIYLVPHVDQRRTREHLRLIFGESWSQNKIAAIARAVYRELGKNVFDAFYLKRLPVKKFNRVVTHDSLDKVQKVYDQGKGGIVITAHTGCFEMLLHFFALHKFRSFAIGKKMHDDELDEIIRGQRSGENIKYMDRSEPTRKVVRYLREGRLFGVLVDQDTAVEGVFADFLGKPAYTPSGPMKIAMRMNIPVFIATTARQSDNTHHVSITGPLPLKNEGAFDADLTENMNKVNLIISRAIEQYPEQWVWMHRRWRRKPEEMKT